MSLLYFLADAFINTFGITQPSATARKRAAFFILGLLVLTLSVAAAAGLVVHLWTH